MGLFDFFTGDPAKKAAEENKRLFQANQAAGMGFLDTGYGRGTEALGQGIAAFDPLSALGTKYGAATNLYQDALGVNGTGGNQRAQSAFQVGPGYQFALDQGLQAAQRGAAGSNMLNSGNTLMTLQDRGQGLANQEYENWLNRLGGFMPGELSATSGAAAGRAAGYGGLASLAERLGMNLTNLGTTTASGQAQANMQKAQAEMQGSGNLWGLGMQLAKLGAGFF